MSKLQYKRLLVKFSGEAVAGEDVHGIDPKILDHMANSVKDVQQLGAEIGIVIGGGNLFRGEKLSKAGMDRVAGDHMGMLATVMNSLALQNSLEKLSLETRVMSAFPIQSICETYIRRRAIRHMQKNRIVICAAGTGNPYFSTDTASALRAAELECKTIYKATQVDGIYNKDPKKYKNAKRFSKITYSEYLSKNLKVLDSAAVSIARENNIPIKIFSILRKNCFKNVYNNKEIYSEIKNV